MITARAAGGLVTGAVADVVGRLLATGSWLRGARVFHPYGVMCTGELVPAQGADRLRPVHIVLFGPTSSGPGSGGIRPGADGSSSHGSGAGTAPRQVLVRLSKSAGTPGALPDLLGLAIRVETDGRPVDLLFATVRAGRVLLTPAAGWLNQPYSTVLPYHDGDSIVWLRARPQHADHPVPSSLDAAREAALAGALEFTIEEAAGPLGSWQPVATLIVTGPADGDVPFDPVLNAHPRLVPVPRWVAEIRRVAYEHSRRARSAPDPDRRPIDERQPITG